MAITPLSRLGALALFLSLALLPALRAVELDWSAHTGWIVPEGQASGLAGTDAREALNVMNRARMTEENGNVRAAIKLYERVAKDHANSVFAPEALYRAGRLYLTRSQYYKAFESFQNLLASYPNYPGFNEVIGEQYRIAAALLDGARNRFWGGTLPGLKNRDRAIMYFETILFNAPFSDYAPLALMNIARAHQRQGNEYEAIDALDRMINNYPQSLLAPDAYLNLAKTHASLVEGAYYDQASTRQAITYFEDFMIQFPADRGVATAEEGLDEMKTMLAESKMKIADFYFHRRSNYRAARVFYNEAITAHPQSAIAARAQAKLVEVEAAQATADGSGPPRRRLLGIF
jgi:outer membrane protein assembly factor BamD